MMEKPYLLELTNAEQEATEIIRRAQEARDRRLKEAKFDAEQELGQVRQKLEGEYLVAEKAVEKLKKILADGFKDEDNDEEESKGSADKSPKEIDDGDEQEIDPKLKKIFKDYKDTKIQSVKLFRDHKNEAIEFLVSTTFDVNVEVPKVVIGKFD